MASMDTRMDILKENWGLQPVKAKAKAKSLPKAVENEKKPDDLAADGTGQLDGSNEKKPDDLAADGTGQLDGSLGTGGEVAEAPEGLAAA
eukprot:6473542-Amphidinium_carterae.1